MDRYTAMRTAVAAHAGQERIDGTPYITHPMWVAGCVARHGEDYEVIAYLHDVVEDTAVHAGMLDLTIPQQLALEAITRKDTERDYAQYIQRVSHNGVATVVKYADLLHNLSTLHVIADEDRRERMSRKYYNALSVLTPYIPT